MGKMIIIIALILSFSATNLLSQNKRNYLTKPTSWYYSKTRISEETNKEEVIYKVFHHSFVVLQVRKNQYLFEKNSFDNFTKTMNISTNQDILKIDILEDFAKINMIDIFGNSINVESLVLSRKPFLMNLSNIKNGGFGS